MRSEHTIQPRGAATTSSPLGHARLAARAEHFLVIDEAVTVRRALRAMLVRAGVPATHVHEADCPDTALEALARSGSGVILMDLIGQHPQDGLDLVQQFLEMDPGLDIVLVTAESRDSEEVKEAFRIGAFAFLAKPLRFAGVRALLNDIDGERGGIDSLR